ncbi:MAG: hypothetical protein RL488_981 [Actinomycetota bacterium]|jgi:nucleoside-diphosphate-sugar epimerase
MSEKPLCLVTGATGYIGGRLIPELLSNGYRVRVLARNAGRLKDHPWIDQVELVDGDAFDPKTGGSHITQTATYAPKGLLGHLYWWSVWPMHGIVFPSMIKQIANG